MARSATASPGGERRHGPGAGIRAGRRRLPALSLTVCALFFVSGLAQTAIVPLLPTLGARYGLSESLRAALLALPGIAMLAVSLPAGLLADRIGPRPVTLAAGVLTAVGCAAQALPGVVPLLVGRTVYAVAFGTLWSAGSAWLAELPGSAGGEAVGAAVVTSSVGTMVGPALAGWLAPGGQAALPFGLTAVVAAGVSASILGHRSPPAPRASAARAAPAGEPRRPATPRLAAALGSIAVVGALSGATQLLIPDGLHAAGVGAGRIGTLFSLCAAGYIAASVVTARRLPAGSPRTLSVNAGMTGLAALSLGPALVSGRAPALALALMLTAVPRGTINVIAYAIAAGDDEDRGSGGRGNGSIYGRINLVWGAATVLVPLAAGALAQRDGTQAGYLVVIVPAAVIAIGLIAALARASAASRRVLGQPPLGPLRVGERVSGAIPPEHRSRRMRRAQRYRDGCGEARVASTVWSRRSSSSGM